METMRLLGWSLAFALSASLLAICGVVLLSLAIGAASILSWLVLNWMAAACTWWSKQPQEEFFYLVNTAQWRRLGCSIVFGSLAIGTVLLLHLLTVAARHRLWCWRF